jgi:hypothetical protein
MHHLSIRAAHPALLLPALAFLLAGCDRSVTDPGVDPVDPYVVECSPSNTVSLAVGQTAQRSGGQAGVFCIQGAAGAEFVLIPMVLDSVPGRSQTVRLTADGTRAIPPGSTPSPVVAGMTTVGHAALLRPSGSGPEVDHAFHHDLRRRERDELSPLVAPATPDRPRWEVPAHAVTEAAVPSVGAFITVNAQAKEACTSPIMRTGEVMAVSNGAIVVADTARPAQGLTSADFQKLASDFDALVAPLIQEHFGSFTDLDGNGRTILFFTPEVNRLAAPNSNQIVGGFFYARDLFPTTTGGGFSGCASSNMAEIIYLAVADPTGAINGNIYDVEYVRSSSLAWITHEMQHLVNAARRLRVLALGQQWAEEVWLNEALSHLSEELLFFRDSGLTPRSNLSLQSLQQSGPAAIDAVNAHHRGNLFLFQRFLVAPELHSPYDSVDNLQGRGAAQQFFRYAADRRTGTEASLTRALTDGPQSGWANLSARLGGSETLRSWLADWGVAIYADDRVPSLATRHRLQSWSHPSIFAALGFDPYPIQTRTLTPTQPIQRTLRSGGALYARFAVDASQVARVEVRVGTGAPPRELHATLLRTR